MSDTKLPNNSAEQVTSLIGGDIPKDYVNLKIAQFDQERSATSHATANGPLSTAHGCDPHEPSKTEAHCYYAGLRSNGRGPKLVYRNAPDVYEKPFGPEQYKRLMRLVPVPDNHAFGKDGLWDRIRDKVVKLLDGASIELTCVDFVRFTWLIEKKDQEIEQEEQEGAEGEGDNGNEDLDYDAIAAIVPVEYGDRYTTSPTIWVGVMPGTLTATAAFEVTKDIRAFLDSLSASEIDIAYRETVPAFSASHGPPLLPTLEDFEPLKAVIDHLSVALSLPISGLETTMQGTMGPYFHVGNRLFAITARHNLFLPEDNVEYRYDGSGPKKDVVLMDTPAFENYLHAIETCIEELSHSIHKFERKSNTLKSRVQGGINAHDLQVRLDNVAAELLRLRAKLNEFHEFYAKVKNGWSHIDQRVIGHIAWAPSIDIGTTPHQYTRDLCVVELYKDRFTHLIGNVLSLGPEYTPWKLRQLLHDNNERKHRFEYPEDGLLPLQDILTAEEILNPETKILPADALRRVVKRGFATNTTVGTVTRYMSFVRKHLPTGHLDSLELPIIPHEKEANTFAKGGDSGSIIVSPRGEFVSLLTSGSNQNVFGSDITYSTMFECVWKLVLEEFPGASLYWDDIPAFLAAAPLAD